MLSFTCGRVPWFRCRRRFGCDPVCRARTSVIDVRASAASGAGASPDHQQCGGISRRGGLLRPGDKVEHSGQFVMLRKRVIRSRTHFIAVERARTPCSLVICVSRQRFPAPLRDIGRRGLARLSSSRNRPRVSLNTNVKREYSVAPTSWQAHTAL